MLLDFLCWSRVLAAYVRLVVAVEDAAVFVAVAVVGVLIEQVDWGLMFGIYVAVAVVAIDYVVGVGVIDTLVLVIAIVAVVVVVCQCQSQTKSTQG